MIVQNVRNIPPKTNFGAMLIRLKPKSPIMAEKSAKLFKGFYYKKSSSINEPSWFIMATKKGSELEKRMVEMYKRNGATSISTEEAQKIFPNFEVIDDENINMLRN